MSECRNRRRGAVRGALVVAAALVATLPAWPQGFGTPVAGGSRTGYIDGALPFNNLRLRYDASYGNPRPSRAEFFWPRPGQPGPPLLEPRVDYQDVSTYVEAAASERFSVFAELPFRILNPTANDNTAGLADLNAGFKYAFIHSEDLVATFQLRAFAPSGDADRGLGNNHVSVEPALLAFVPLSDRWTLEGEFRVWIPIDGTEFAGEIVRYGVGSSYTIYENCDFWIAPVVEFVGWTVLGGKASFGDGAGGDTIVNAKVGVRLGVRGTGDIYVGYGRALTGDKWYEDTLRLEARLAF